MSAKRIIYVLFVILVAGLSALAGTVAGGVAVYSALKGTPQPIQAVQQPAAQAPNAIQLSNTQIESTITQAVEKVGPAVVTVVGVMPGQPTFFGLSSDEQVSGSGVIISSDGYILTNNHVVEGTSQVSIILADGTELPVKTVGTDLYADLAVLKTDGKVPSVATLGNSETLRPGETVIAIGSPLGDFKNTAGRWWQSLSGHASGLQMEDRSR
jgi:2-alkenal reductase